VNKKTSKKVTDVAENLEQTPGEGTGGGVEETPKKVAAPERAITADDMETLSQAVRDGVKNGNVLVSWDTVDVSATKSPTGKAAFKYYIRIEAVNAAGQSAVFGKINAATPEGALAEGISAEERKVKTAKGACDYANYGLDLERRANARQALLSELEGPERAVKNAVKSMLGLEMPVSEIRDMILNSPKYKSVEGLAAVIDSALQAAS
jgi:hypothetical protein